MAKKPAPKKPAARTSRLRADVPPDSSPGSRSDSWSSSWRYLSLSRFRVVLRRPADRQRFRRLTPPRSKNSRRFRCPCSTPLVSTHPSLRCRHLLRSRANHCSRQRTRRARLSPRSFTWARSTAPFARPNAGQPLSRLAVLVRGQTWATRRVLPLTSTRARQRSRSIRPRTLRRISPFAP